MTTRRGSVSPPEPPRKRPVTKDLIEGIVRWLSDPTQRSEGHDQRWLAEQVGMDEGQLSRTLKGEYRTSKHVDRLVEVTGIHYDVLEGIDAEKDQLLRLFSELSAPEREMLKLLLEQHRPLLASLRALIESRK